MVKFAIKIAVPVVVTIGTIFISKLIKNKNIRKAVDDTKVCVIDAYIISKRLLRSFKKYALDAANTVFKIINVLKEGDCWGLPPQPSFFLSSIRINGLKTF